TSRRSRPSGCDSGSRRVGGVEGRWLASAEHRRGCRIVSVRSCSRMPSKISWRDGAMAAKEALGPAPRPPPAMVRRLFELARSADPLVALIACAGLLEMRLPRHRRLEALVLYLAQEERARRRAAGDREPGP